MHARSVRCRAGDRRGRERHRHRHGRPDAPSARSRLGAVSTTMAWDLLHAQQEDVDDARPSLGARRCAPPGDDPRARAMVLHAHGRDVRRARAAPTRPCDCSTRPPRSRPRGNRPSRTRVQKRSAACGAGRRRRHRLREAAMASPLDDALWSHLPSRTAAPTSRPSPSMRPRRGLALSPRDADMLRVQALALERRRRPRGRGRAGPRRLCPVAIPRRRARHQERLRPPQLPCARWNACRSTCTRCDARPRPLTRGGRRRAAYAPSSRVLARSLSSGRRGAGFAPRSASRRARSRSAGRRSRAASRRCCSRPTGSGKTLAAFLVAIDRLVAHAPDGQARTATRVLYVSPLKALAVDVERNLRAAARRDPPRAGATAARCTHRSCGVRTGDTPSKERARMARRPRTSSSRRPSRST